MPRFNFGGSKALSSTEQHEAHPLYYRNRGRAHMLRMQLREKHMTMHDKTVLHEIEAQIHDPKTPISDLHCVECDRPFLAVSVEEKEIDYCPHCACCWLYPTELKYFTHLSRDIPGDESPSRDSQYTCPRCHVVMREYVFMRPYTVLVDRCPHGHGIFLPDHILDHIFEIC